MKKIKETNKNETKISSNKNHQEDKKNVLSDREMTVLKLLTEGFNYKQIAEQLFISPLTAKTHIKHIYKKLNIHTKLEAVKISLINNWF